MELLERAPPCSDITVSVHFYLVARLHGFRFTIRDLRFTGVGGILGHNHIDALISR